jgi:hypothetical protein
VHFLCHAWMVKLQGLREGPWAKCKEVHMAGNALPEIKRGGHFRNGFPASAAVLITFPLL